MDDRHERVSRALRGRYEIERELGRGATATVFLALDRKHDRRVAIKVMHPELSAQLHHERFIREIQVAARLTHPHIVPIFDSGETDGLLHYEMAFIPGETLEARLARGPLAWDEAVALTRDVASALDYAHRQGLVHRDIKPANILISQEGAFVTDFGIAKAIADSGGLRLTATGVSPGTPVYMSPEQCLGTVGIGPSSDLYSLGCVVHESLAGAPPFVSETLSGLIRQHLDVPPPDLHRSRPELPAHIPHAVRRALAKRPEDRFATATSFVTALAGESPARPLVSPARARSRFVAAVAGIALAAIAAVIVWKSVERSSGGSIAARGTPAWVLVTDMSASGNDPELTRVVRYYLASAIDESRGFRTLPPDAVRQALVLADKPSGLALTDTLALELAYRNSVPLVLDGGVARVGAGCSVVLRALDGTSGETRFVCREQARSEGELLPALERLAGKLRRELSQVGTAEAATFERPVVPTRNLEAYKSFVRGIDVHRSGDYASCLGYYRHALSLDSTLASAWVELGIAYGNLGHGDSALAAFDRALSRPDRLTARYLHVTQARVAELNGDLAGALRACEAQLAEDPLDHQAQHRKGRALLLAGRYEEGLAATREAERLSPIQPPQATIWNQFVVLVELGRLSAADSTWRKLGPPHRRYAEFAIAAALGAWPRADSLANAAKLDPSSAEWVRALACLTSAAAAAHRGDVNAVPPLIIEADRIATRANRPDVRYAVILARLVMERAVPGTAARAPITPPRDSSFVSVLISGIDAATVKDRARASRALRTLRARPQSEQAQEASGLVLLEALDAEARADWDAVDSLLKKPAIEGARFELFIDPTGKTALRYLRAQALERAGRSAEAATAYELAMRPAMGANGYEIPFVGFIRRPAPRSR